MIKGKGKNSQLSRRFFIILLLLVISASGCDMNAMPPGADIAAGGFKQTGYGFMRWKQGLAIMVWHDVAGDTNIFSRGESAGLGTKPFYELQGYAASQAGRIFEWKVQTNDGQTAQFWLEGVPYNLANGTLFIVTLEEGNVRVTQLARDLSQVRPNHDSCVAFAQNDPDLAAFINQASTSAVITPTPSPNSTPVPILKTQTPIPTLTAPLATTTPIPQRIRFTAGATSATVHDTVLPASTQRYILGAMAGQTLIVDIVGPVALGLRVSGVNGTILVQKQMDNPGHWEGQLPATQDYILELIAPGTEVNYDLSLTIPPIPDPPPAMSTYYDPDHSFEMQYPSDFGAGMTCADAVIIHNPIASFRLLGDTYYAGTNLLDACVTVGIDRSPTGRSTCMEADLAHHEEDLGQVDINGILFTKIARGGVALGHISDVVVYRTLRDNICYEVAEFLRYSSMGVYEPGTVTEFNKDIVVDKLQGVIQSFRFTRAATSTWHHLPPGLMYRTFDGLWMINEDEYPVQIYNKPQALPTSDGRWLFSYDAIQQDIWLADWRTGSQLNLTQTPDQIECCFQWESQQPDTVFFGAAAPTASAGASDDQLAAATYYLATVNINGEGYRVLDAEHPMNIAGAQGTLALAPDGQTVAYGHGSLGWFYHWDQGIESFDPLAYGLSPGTSFEIAQPAWSPDGVHLAWVLKLGVTENGHSEQTGIVVFDLAARTAQILHQYASQGTGWPPAPVWSPDGQWIAFVDSSTSENAGLWVAQIGDAPILHHLGLGGNPVWNPSGQWLAFQSMTQHGIPSYTLVATGVWEHQPLDISVDRLGQLAAWINLKTMSNASAPKVNAFTADPIALDQGQGIALAWEAVGSHATLCPLVNENTVGCRCLFGLPLAGSHIIKPTDIIGTYTGFQLTVEAAGIRTVRTVPLTVVCPNDGGTWFFDKALGLCPKDPPLFSHAAIQQFEHGLMIWVEALDEFYVLLDHDQHITDSQGTSSLTSLRIIRGPLELKPGASVDHRVAETPPPGLFEPISGFGLLWRGEVTGTETIRPALGWAKAPEYGFDTAYQCAISCGANWDCYLQGPKEEVFHFYYLMHFGHYWEQVV